MTTIRHALSILAALVPTTAFAQVQLEWFATHDGVSAGLDDSASEAAVDAAGNVFLACSVMVLPNGTTQVDLNKYSPNGTLLWTRRIDAPTGTNDRALDLAVAANGDVCVGGVPYFVARFDTHGNVLWSDLGTGLLATAAAIEFDALDNAVVAGTITTSPNPSNILLRAYTPTGAVAWHVEIDGRNHGSDGAADVAIDAFGNVLVAGAADNKAYVSSRDAMGAEQWTIEFGTGSSGIARVISDGLQGAYVTGHETFSNGFGSYKALFVARVGSTGTLLWKKQLDIFDDWTGDLLVDDGVLHCTLTNEPISASEVKWVRFSESGQPLSTFTFDGLQHTGAYAGSFVRGSAGQIYVVGRTGSPIFPSASDETFVIQMNRTGAVDWIRQLTVPGVVLSVFSKTSAPNNRLVASGNTEVTPDKDALIVQFDLNDSPQTYCTAKSASCTPSLGFTGTSSAAATSGFTVTANQVRNNKAGLFLYGVTGAASTPFGGGLLCVAAPISRSPTQNSGGTPPPANDCSGTYSLDFNAFASGSLGGNPLPALLVPGTAVHVQAWGRDPAFTPPDNIALSNGLRYVVLP